MNLQTFKASTMAEALGQVKTSMGHDAVILHTRTYHTRHWLGRKRREIGEITAGRGMHVGQRQRTPVKPSPALENNLLTQVQQRPAALPTAAAVVVKDPIANGRQLLETSAGGTAVMLGLTQEMSTLKTMVKDLCSQVRQSKAPQVPEDLFDYYMTLIQNQVAEELAQEIVATLQ